MANAFWGGFATGLLKERQREQGLEDEINTYKRKQEILKELERREEPDPDRGVFVIYDGNGKAVGTRPMTEYQRKEYKAKAEGTELDLRRGRASASLDEFKANTAKEDRQRDYDFRQADDKRADAQLAISRGQLGISRGHLDLAQQEAQRGKGLEGTARGQSKQYSNADVFNEVTADSDVREMMNLGGPTAMNALKSAIETVMRRKDRDGFDLRTAVNIVKNGLRSSLGGRVYSVKNPPKTDSNPDDELTNLILTQTPTPAPSP